MKILKTFAAALLCLSFGVTLSAGPAKGRVLLEQPDGTTIAACLTGDEHMRILTDLQGHALVQGNDGYYCYAVYDGEGNKTSTGVRVGKKASSTVLTQSSAIPYSLLSEIGNQRRQKANEMRSQEEPILKRMGVGSSATRAKIAPKKSCAVVLAEFSDVPMTYTKEDIERVFNEKGYSAYHATGSVSDYFNDQLAGECEFTFFVTDVVKLRGTQKTYGANVSGGDKDPEGAVREACVTASRQGLIDFSQFDDDNDGEVDNVFVVVSGKDEADGGGDDAIWAHQYRLEYVGKTVTLNGKKVNTYTIASELAKRYSTGQFGVATISTFCHEYGHALGLMDMYDVDGSGSGGYSPGFWSTGVMDTGCYLNDGNTPAHYNAVDYDTIECGNPEMLTLGTKELSPIGTSRKYYKIEGSVKNEYYLIECRDNKGWDKYIGGKGMAIYHVDHSNNKIGGATASFLWEMDGVNNNPSHMCAQMVAPVTNCNRASMAFWPYGSVNTFSPESTPAFRYWNGESAGVVLTDIERSGDNVRFYVVDAKSYLIPDMIAANVDAFQTEAIVTVEVDKHEFTGSAVLAYSVNGEAKEVSLKNIGNGKLAVRIDGLEPGTSYPATVCLAYGKTMGDPKDVSFKTMAANPEGEPYIYMTSTTQIPLVVFDASSVDDIRWYYDGQSIYTSNTGYFTPTKSGRLKASIRYSDGDHETIIKDIIVK